MKYEMCDRFEFQDLAKSNEMKNILIVLWYAVAMPAICDLQNLKHIILGHLLKVH